MKRRTAWTIVSLFWMVLLLGACTSNSNNESNSEQSENSSSVIENESEETEEVADNDTEEIKEESVAEPVAEEAIEEKTNETEAMAACNAVEKTPGGSFPMCADISCDTLNGSNMISYSEREPVAACNEETFVGQCQLDDKLITYYDGKESSLKMGCGFSGTWLEK